MYEIFMLYFEIIDKEENFSLKWISGYVQISD